MSYNRSLSGGGGAGYTNSHYDEYHHNDPHSNEQHYESSSSSSSNTRHLLSVTTDTGAKHQVRALLALAGGAPISGDLRYGDNHNSHGYQQGRVDQPLPDGSVALHARDVYLPTVSLGSMEFLKDKPFVATIPKRWREFFGISEDDTRRLCLLLGCR